MVAMMAVAVRWWWLLLLATLTLQSSHSKRSVKQKQMWST